MAILSVTIRVSANHVSFIYGNHHSLVGIAVSLCSLIVKRVQHAYQDICRGKQAYHIYKDAITMRTKDVQWCIQLFEFDVRNT